MRKSAFYHVHQESHESADLVGNFVARCPSLVAAIEFAIPLGPDSKVRREDDGLTFSFRELKEAVELANSAKDSYESLIALGLSYVLNNRNR